MTAAGYEKYTIFNAVIQKPTGDSSWVDVDLRKTHGATPLEAACSVLTVYVDYKIGRWEEAQQLNGFRVVVTPVVYGSEPQEPSVIVTAAEVYLEMVREEKVKFLAQRESLPAAEAAYKKAQRDYQHLKWSVGYGPRRVEEKGKLAALAGADPAAVAEVAKIPRRPRTARAPKPKAALETPVPAKAQDL